MFQINVEDSEVLTRAVIAYHGLLRQRQQELEKSLGDVLKELKMVEGIKYVDTEIQEEESAEHDGSGY